MHDSFYRRTNVGAKRKGHLCWIKKQVRGVGVKPPRYA